MEKVKRSIKRDLVLASIVLVVILVTVISVFTNAALKNNMIDETKDGLQGAAYSIVDVF